MFKNYTMTEWYGNIFIDNFNRKQLNDKISKFDGSK